MRTAPKLPDRLTIEHLAPSAIRPNPDNARKHSTKQVTKLAASIHALGFNGPIIIDEAGMILAGHARLEAALKLGLEEIPCVRLTHLTPTQKIAFAIADNKLGDLSGFDPDRLKAQIQKIVSFDFNVELTGFETGEIDVMLDPLAIKPTIGAAEDEVDLPNPDAPAVTRPGDLWVLGSHKLFCGTALEADSYERLLGDERAGMVITDPPYNVPINGHVSGLGRVKHAEFAMASGEMSDAEFRDFLMTYTALAALFTKDGSMHFHFIDWRGVEAMLSAGRQAYTELKNICVWDKTNASMGSLYRSQHELVCVFKNGKAKHCNNVELGRYGRYRTNVWTYAGANSFGRTRDADLAAHPTVKPVGLIADAIRDCSKRGDLILDPFAGSGTIFLAAERTGRRAAGIELSPAYVDVAISRWEGKAGKAAVLAEDGRTFAEVRQQRLAGEAR